MASKETITISKQEFDQIIAKKDQQIANLTHQLAELKKMIFGSRRERFVSTADPLVQPSLFEVEQTQQVEHLEEEITYKRKKKENKKQPLRTELPAHLPRIEEVIEPENIPEGSKKIGESVTEILEYEPGKLFVRKIIRPKYITGSTDEKTDIAIAELPLLPIPKGNAGPGILAHILISKYVDHLPLFRQLQMFKRQDFALASSTINGWFNASCNLLKPLYGELMQKVIAAGYLMVDETPMPVLTKDKPGSTHKGYYWVYYAPVERLVLFDYRKSRGREGPNEMLKGFSGYLQTDGYDAYNHFEKQPGITLLACMAHARRYFDKAKDNDAQRAEHALTLFQKLYDIERSARVQELNPEQTKELRQGKAVPVLTEMHAWLKEEINETVPKSAIGKAMAYSLKLWPRLIRYTQDGQLQIDNNLVENSIRPVALGRKNFLFAGSHDAAQNAAMVYSLLATCKMNNVEPFEWLRNVLEVIPGYPQEDQQQMLKLLPGQE